MLQVAMDGQSAEALPAAFCQESGRLKPTRHLAKVVDGIDAILALDDFDWTLHGRPLMPEWWS